MLYRELLSCFDKNEISNKYDVDLRVFSLGVVAFGFGLLLLSLILHCEWLVFVSLFLIFLPALLALSVGMALGLILGIIIASREFINSLVYLYTGKEDK